MVKGKIRLDHLLVERGLADSRTRAQALIMAGKVLVDDRPHSKPGHPVSVTAAVRLKDMPAHQWVSRGALKLLRGIDAFNLNVQEAVCLDVGASTGGFSEVLLHHGAARVYAVDVGYGQLAWSLRNNPKVVVLERTNARHLTETEIPEKVDCIVCDASFIGLDKVLPVPLTFARTGAMLIALIKPQFEAGPDKVGKGGIVRDQAVYADVCADVRMFLAQSGWRVLDVIDSPITGADGNHEFLIGAVRD